MKNTFRIVLLFISFMILWPARLWSQTPEVQTAIKADVSIPFREMIPAKQPLLKKLFPENEKEVPNRFHVKPMVNSAAMGEPDGALQVTSKMHNAAALVQTLKNFEGLNNAHNTGGRTTPPDPAGDVGPNHYVQAVNSMIRMYDKNGNILLGPVTTSTIWNGFSGNWDGHNDGDAVVLYDELADRWIISQFAIDCPKVGGLYTEYQLVAVSATADPTGAYYRYAFQFDYMPDYPKLGVWQDGYYMAVNRFNTNIANSKFIGAGAAVLNRTKILAGDPSATMIYYKCETLGGSGSAIGSDCYSMLPGDCDGTYAPAGTPGYFTYMNDDSWGGNDELRIWALKPDWTTPANSTMTFVTALPVAAFSLFTTGSEIAQKGTTLKLECLDDRLMYRQQYRNMGTYESMVTCHSVNTGSNVGGVRWYEMRKSGSLWTLYQQGTYTLSDTKSRWLGSVAMNGAGDIALGYTLSNSSINPSIYFTGRKSTDPLGTMTYTESPIVDGAYSMTGTSSRWGDYAMMSVDPTDDRTFWHTNEYIYSSSGTWPWGTKIASFKFTLTPAVTTLDATSVTSVSAVLNARVNPRGTTTDYYFEYGTSISYGSSTSTISAGSGNTDVNVNATISGLSAGSIYHFRIVAYNTDGISTGNDLTFIPGTAVVTTAAASAISAISATAGGNVTSDGGSSITARGVCWGIASGPTISASHTVDGSGTGTFSSSLTGLTDNTLFYYRAYATNSTGTVYGNELTFTTISVAAPVAADASGITPTGFTSNWNAVDGAQSYKLDVSTTNTFTSGTPGTLTEGFAGGPATPAGWTFTSIGGIYTSTGNYGAASPSLKMDATGDIVQTPSVSGSATSLSFWMKGQGTDATSALLVEGYNGSTWTTIQDIKNPPTTGTTFTYSTASSPALPPDLVKFRFTYTRSAGNLSFDDVSIIYATASSFVPGYNNLSVSGHSQTVSGLTGNTPYYYRIRATGTNSSSGNSNIITVTTGAVVSTPELTVSIPTLVGFTYVAGSGPSASQTYTLSGSNLTGIPGNIAVSGSTNYEVSVNNTNFSGSVNVPYSSASLTGIPIYIRLMTGLSAGTYNNEVIANAGGGASTANVICSGSVSALTEPTNYPASFSAYNILLQWIDAAGTSLPDGYLIRMSSIGYSAIGDPVDGVAVEDGPNDKNIPYGMQNARFGNLAPGTTYYFKIYGYTGVGSNINYKTDGSIPQVQQITSP